MTNKCCDIVYWKHSDGWDAYRKEDCHLWFGNWTPRWFDMAIVEDSPTLSDCKLEISAGWHPHNLVCLVSS